MEFFAVMLAMIVTLSIIASYLFPARKKETQGSLQEPQERIRVSASHLRKELLDELTMQVNNERIVKPAKKLSADLRHKNEVAAPLAATDQSKTRLEKTMKFWEEPDCIQLDAYGETVKDFLFRAAELRISKLQVKADDTRAVLHARFVDGSEGNYPFSSKENGTAFLSSVWSFRDSRFAEETSGGNVNFTLYRNNVGEPAHFSMHKMNGFGGSTRLSIIIHRFDNALATTSKHKAEIKMESFKLVTSLVQRDFVPTHKVGHDGPNSYSITSVPVTSADKKPESITISKSFAEKWEELFTRHDNAVAKWSDYEFDLEKVIRYPLVSDASDPRVMDMHLAMNRANMLRPELGDADKNPAQTEYADAVLVFITKLNAVIHAAKKAAWSNFSAVERKKLETAINMLSIARNEGAAPAERQVAYRRVLKELEGLILLPEEAVLHLESAIRKEISSR